MDPVELDCFELKQAVKGLGTDEEALYEILASRSNDRIKAINETYQKSRVKYLLRFEYVLFDVISVFENVGKRCGIRYK
jgi:hypothetical protein